MEKQVIFRDYQEQIAADHNNLQANVRASIDHLVNDIGTSTRKYAGFGVAKTAQVEVTVQVGRMYDVAGAVFSRSTALTQNVAASLASASKKVISVSVYGSEVETDTEERDFLVDVATGRTEPEAVSMTRSRNAVLAFTAGAEGADPQPPTLGANHVEIARILVDTTQIVSVTQIESNRIVSTGELDGRTDSLEAFRDQVLPTIASLRSDLADLAARMARTGKANDLVTLYEDMSRLKDLANLPDDHADYGGDSFLVPDESDIANAANLGFDAKVEMGIRFPDANADEFELELFSSLDPNAALSNGFLLPKYSHDLKLSTGPYSTDIGIGQYGYQTFEMVQKTMRKERLRYGGQYYVCSNGSRGWSKNPEAEPYWLPGYETYQTVSVTNNGDWGHYVEYYDYWWHDSWIETYWSLEVQDHTITGAQIAQSFLVSNDMWATRLRFWCTQKGGNDNIIVSLCEVKYGVPDLEQVIAHQSYPHASIVTGWNSVDITPTFLEKGKRYAVLFTSNANHRFGMAEGNDYLAGTFFYSTDAAYYQGDLTKDLMLEVYGAKFATSQVVIEMKPINLDGGFRNIDITASMIAPQSTQLVWEMLPSGGASWLPLARDVTDVLANAPPLARFRARFVGTPDMMPGIKLTGSRVYISRPKVAFTHITTPITLGSASDEIVVKLLVEGFDETPHDFGCRLRVGSSWETPDTTATELIDASRKRYQRVYTFNLGAPTSTFRIETTGLTNSPATTFHIAERLHYSA